MNQELWNGIGQINDNLISGAEKEKVRAHFKRRKKNLWVKYGSLAACLCLVVCLCVPLINIMSGGNKASGNDGSPESPQQVFCVGSVIVRTYGTLTYNSCTDTTVTFTFTLEKATDEPIYVSFNATKIIDTWIENGKEYSHGEELFASTDENYNDPGRTNLGRVLRLTVNGSPAEQIPTAPGTYEITVDFSAMLGEDIIMNNIFHVRGFGAFGLSEN